MAGGGWHLPPLSVLLRAPSLWGHSSHLWDSTGESRPCCECDVYQNSWSGNRYSGCVVSCRVSAHSPRAPPSPVTHTCDRTTGRWAPGQCRSMLGTGKKHTHKLKSLLDQWLSAIFLKCIYINNYLNWSLTYSSLMSCILHCAVLIEMLVLVNKNKIYNNNTFEIEFNNKLNPHYQLFQKYFFNKKYLRYCSFSVLLLLGTKVIY